VSGFCRACGGKIVATPALRILICLYGLMFVVIGVAFFVAPAELAARFALSAQGAPGLAVLRADFPAFFICTGGFAIHGAVRQHAAPLALPLAGLCIAIAGRAVSLAFDGFTAGALTPMAVEALGIVLLAAGYRAFSGRA